MNPMCSDYLGFFSLRQISLAQSCISLFRPLSWHFIDILRYLAHHIISIFWFLWKWPVNWLIPLNYARSPNTLGIVWYHRHHASLFNASIKQVFCCGEIDIKISKKIYTLILNNIFLKSYFLIYLKIKYIIIVYY